jgi:integrase/recombinase XerD
MLQRDLAAARAAWIREARTDGEREQREASDFLRYEDAAGQVADFHALRHTYISGIVAGGASVKTAQELARHSTPVLIASSTRRDGAGLDRPENARDDAWS